MQIKLNNIVFDLAPVPSDLRAVLLTDETISQGVWREVYHWDSTSQTGKTLVATTASGTVPLGNGINFFVAKPGGDGLTKNDSASAKMAERFLEALGAKAIMDVVRAVNSIVNLAQKSIPLTNYAALNPVASYSLRMHVDFAVIALRNAARNLTAYAFVPGQVAFHHELSAITDQAGYDALPAPSMAQLMPAYIVPPQNKANHAIRSLALQRRIIDLQPVIKALPAGPGDMTTEGLRRSYARLAAEWKALTEAAKPKTKAPFIA